MYIGEGGGRYVKCPTLAKTKNFKIQNYLVSFEVNVSNGQFVDVGCRHRVVEIIRHNHSLLLAGTF